MYYKDIVIFVLANFIRTSPIMYYTPVDERDDAVEQ